MTLCGLTYVHGRRWGIYIGTWEAGPYPTREAALDALVAELALRARLRVLGEWGMGPDRLERHIARPVSAILTSGAPENGNAPELREQHPGRVCRARPAPGGDH